MAFSYNKYTGTGAVQFLSVPDYIDQSHIHVSFDGVDTPSFTWINSNTISLTAPANTIVKVYRKSSPDVRVTDYESGVPLTEAALDNDSRQAFFMAQEQLDSTNDALDIIGSPSFEAITDQIEANAAAAASSAAAAAASAASAVAIGGLTTGMVAGLYGQAITKTVGGADPSMGGKFGENIVINNPTGKTGYAIRYAVNRHTGHISSGSNEISDALISQWDSGNPAALWNRWDVAISPLAYGSGYFGAPSVAQAFYLVNSEVNLVNRHSDNGSWWPEPRVMVRGVGGEQMVAETQDFSGLLGSNRVGFHLNFGYVVSRSPYTSTATGKHARFYSPFMVSPNSVAPNGAAFYGSGFREYPASVSIVSGGTGYTVGDLLTFNTGLNQLVNENTVLKVLSVSSGVIIAVEVYIAGGYTSSFAGTVGVTGGTGTGATFTYTLAGSGEHPNSCYGIGGTWKYGIDFCTYVSATYARCTLGAMRLPNNQAIVAKNAADNNDVTLLKLNTTDQVEVAGQKIITRRNWTPTFSADSGALTSVVIVSARYGVADGVCQYQLTFQIADKGSATGAIRFTPPVAAAAYAFMSAGMNVTSGVGLACQGANGSGYVRVTIASTGGDPMVNTNFYTITGTYEAA